MLTTILFVSYIVVRLAKWYYSKKFGILLKVIPFIVVGTDRVISAVFGLKPEVRNVEEFYEKMLNNKGGNNL